MNKDKSNKKHKYFLLGIATLGVVPFLLQKTIIPNDSSKLKDIQYDKNIQLKYLENISLANLYKDIDSSLEEFTYENIEDLKQIQKMDSIGKFIVEKIGRKIKEKRLQNIQEQDNLTFFKLFNFRKKYLEERIFTALKNNIDETTKYSLETFLESIKKFNLNEKYDFSKEKYNQLINQIINFDDNALECLIHPIKFLSLIKNLYASAENQFVNQSIKNEVNKMFKQLKKEVENENKIDFKTFTIFKNHLVENINQGNQEIDQEIINKNNIDIFNNLVKLGLEVENLKKDLFFTNNLWKQWSLHTKDWIKNKELTKNRELCQFFYLLFKEEFKQLNITNELNNLYRIAYAKIYSNIKFNKEYKNQFENYLIMTKRNYDSFNYNINQKKINSYFFNDAYIKKNSLEKINWNLFKTNKKTFFDKYFLKDDFNYASKNFDDFLNQKEDLFTFLINNSYYESKKKIKDEIEESNFNITKEIFILLIVYLNIQKETNIFSKLDFNFNKDEIEYINYIFKKIQDGNLNFTKQAEVEKFKTYIFKILEIIKNKKLEFYSRIKDKNQVKYLNFISNKTKINEEYLFNIPNENLIFNYDVLSKNNFSFYFLTYFIGKNKNNNEYKIKDKLTYLDNLNKQNSINFNSKIDGIFTYWDIFLNLQNNNLKASSLLKIKWTYSLKITENFYTSHMKQVLKILKFAEEKNYENIINFIVKEFLNISPNDWLPLKIQELEKLYLEAISNIEDDNELKNIRKEISNLFENNEFLVKTHTPYLYNYLKNSFFKLNDFYEQNNIDNSNFFIKRKFYEEYKNILDFLRNITSKTIPLLATKNNKEIEELKLLTLKLKSDQLKKSINKKIELYANQLNTLDKNFVDLFYKIIDLKYEILLSLAKEKQENFSFNFVNSKNIFTSKFSFKNLFANENLNIIHYYINNNEIAFVYKFIVENHIFYGLYKMNNFSRPHQETLNENKFNEISQYANNTFYLEEGDINISDSIDEQTVLNYLEKHFIDKNIFKYLRINNFYKDKFLDYLKMEFDLFYGDKKKHIKMIFQNVINYNHSQVWLNNEVKKSLKDIYIDKEVFTNESNLTKENIVKNILIRNPKLKIFIDKDSINIDKANKKIIFNLKIYEYDSTLLTEKDYLNKEKIFSKEEQFEYSYN